ncbi:hypothetical protein J2N86_07440 [Legionella lytica]|uniref:Substrate of the Dot/Icm secretion system n=1 Tax=Legionella lytica TaxID=96232 RepID=A0ABY4Y5P5_9GAMM|nr:hypothetical protein [Legionella lytica]USQ12560.1 hypothetical protein J2N86_07440 [Legionella lytica]
MTLKTVGYEFLRINIQNLKREYSNYLERYTIEMTEAEKKDASEITDNPLLILLDRVNKYVVQCKTDRVSDRDVFPKLTDEIRRSAQTTAEDKKRDTLYLLGGLIHRYLRIETEYNEYNQSRLNLYSWFSRNTLWKPTDCRLYVAIKSALGLSEANKLDDYTIVNALEVFQENMEMDVEVEEQVGKEKKQVKKKRYQTYPHFSTVDPNFKSNLEKMIATHKESGKSMIRQFEAIDFLQSLMKKLDQENQPIEREINEWCASLAKTHKNFGLLSKELIEQHLNQYYQSKPEKTNDKEHIQYLLEGILNNPTFIANNDHSKFLNELVISNTDPSRSICCGAYILLLKQGNLDKKLVTQMTNAFGFSEKLTIEVQVACLKAFKAYADDVTDLSKASAPEDEVQLDYKFFGTSKTMVSQTTQLIVMLGEEKAHSLVM